MKFAADLVEEADRFIRDVIKKPYLAVHMRRGDFLFSKRDAVPTIDHMASQIKDLMAEYGVKHVFIATDVRNEDAEYRLLFQKKMKFYRYPNGKGIENPLYSQPLYGEGQRAIIEQIICTKAKVFIGTRDSTFTFRINEER